MAGWLTEAILKYQDYPHRGEIAKIIANAHTSKVGRIRWEQLRNDRAMAQRYYSSTYWDFVQHVIEFLLFVLVVIALNWMYKRALKLRAANVQAKINKYKPGAGRTPNQVPVSKNPSQRAPAVQPGQSYGININPALNDAAAQLEHYAATNGKDAKIALDLFKQRKEFEMAIASMTRELIEAQIKLDEAVTRAERREQEKFIQQLHNKLEAAELQLKIEATLAKTNAIQGARTASLGGQDRPAALEGHGLSPHFGDKEIKDEAFKLAFKARSAGKDVDQAVQSHLKTLKGKYPPRVVEEIFDYYQENLKFS